MRSELASFVAVSSMEASSFGNKSRARSEHLRNLMLMVSRGILILSVTP